METQEDSTALLVLLNREPLNGLHLALQNSGYRVIQTSNARHAADIVRRVRPAVVIAELAKTTLDPFDILCVVKEIDVRITFAAFVSNSGLEHAPRKAYHYGAELVLDAQLDPAHQMNELARVMQPVQHRWNEKPASVPEDRVGVCISSLDEAMERRVCCLGRGGLLLCGIDNAPRVGSRVAFAVKATEGPLQRIEGVGIVRWACAADEFCPLSGLGIEFEFIEEQFRQPLLQRLESSPCRPYIPCLCVPPPP